MGRSSSSPRLITNSVRTSARPTYQAGPIRVRKPQNPGSMCRLRSADPRHRSVPDAATATDQRSTDDSPGKRSLPGNGPAPGHGTSRQACRKPRTCRGMHTRTTRARTALGCHQPVNTMTVAGNVHTASAVAPVRHSRVARPSPAFSCQGADPIPTVQKTSSAIQRGVPPSSTTAARPTTRLPRLTPARIMRADAEYGAGRPQSGAGHDRTERGTRRVSRTAALTGPDRSRAGPRWSTSGSPIPPHRPVSCIVPCPARGVRGSRDAQRTTSPAAGPAARLAYEWASWTAMGARLPADSPARRDGPEYPAEPDQTSHAQHQPQNEPGGSRGQQQRQEGGSAGAPQPDQCPCRPTGGGGGPPTCSEHEQAVP